MALRLRRGTDSERQLITPVEGELIYTTDTKLLYAGDGSTVGGTLVTGAGGGGSLSLNSLTDTDLTGASNNDILTYVSASNKWEAVSVPGVGVLGLNDISGVFMPSTPTNGDILKYDGINFTAQPLSEAFSEQQNYKINLVNVSLARIASIVPYNANTPVTINNDNGTPLQVVSVTTGNLGGFPLTEYLSVKGTLATPQSVAAGDVIGGWKITGYDSISADGKVAALWVSAFASDAVVTDAYPKSTGQLLVSKGGNSYNQFMFGSEGEFKAPGAITPGVFADAAARDAGITTPTAGMMVFVTDVAKFQGYAGGAWANLN